ncbi:MAG: hypothetical protein HYX88_03130 [Chloroflexi bacterium]|nr:hypothetical protein [Chloroflexota bacterium]
MTELAAIPPYEARIQTIYQSLKELIQDPQAPPCVVCNARQALAPIWQMVNDLDLGFEHLYYLEV